MRARAAKTPSKGALILWLALYFAGAGIPNAWAQDYPVRDNFGGVGMIDMPSARMAPDGELYLGASFFQNAQHYNLGFQALPWLETSFRYSGLRHFDPAFPVYWDRSFAIKARLWDETNFFPAMAIGVNDLVGTGVYSGEYVVTSKRFGAFDASLGIGWGRLGSTALFKNPFASISHSFDNRPSLTGAGGANFNVFFHGPNAGLFGGVVWHTPINRLSLITEYSSDKYDLETARGSFKPKNQINVGLSYQAMDGVTAGLGWLYGRSISGSLSIQLDPTRPQYIAKLDAPVLPVEARSTDEQQQALQALMKFSRGQRTSQQAKANRGDFADALWRITGTEGVEIQGRSLVLVAKGDVGRHCITAAQIAQSFDNSIDHIVVRGIGAGKAVQCVTASASEPVYQNTPLPIATTIASTIPNSSSTMVIDAVGIDVKASARAIRADARRQKIGIEALAVGDGTATVYYTNNHYFAEADALDRLTRLLMKDAPPDIERFRLIAITNGVAQQEFDILRGPEERRLAQDDSLGLFGDTPGATFAPAPMQNPTLAEASRNTYPRFSWNIYPQLRQELFDPANPFAIELAAIADGSVQIWPGASLNGEVETSIFNNFNLERQSDSTLPHVRSDFLKYFARGQTGIGQLDAEYRFRIAPTVFAAAKAGYLESMFAGGGGEILWRPEGQRWALGADAYEVWQRGFDRLFDLQRYHVFTGHVSLYYVSPWYDLNFVLSAGQYLAGDRGLTFQMTRRFSTGVEIGAFFTKTNISSAQFGEGSFDKGILIRIPLGWALPIETQGRWDMDLRPVQRDGGQRLIGDALLFGETRQTSYAEIVP